MPGYSPDEIPEFAKRFPGPNPIATGEEAALAVPGFGEEIRRVNDEIFHLSHYVLKPLGEREQLEEQRRRLIVEAHGLNRPAAEGSKPRRKPGRQGTDYPGPGVEEIVRLAHDAEREGRQLGRTLRDEIAKAAKVTAYETDLVFDLIRAGTLEDAGRKGWLIIDGQLSATPATINLHELKPGS